MDCFRRNIVPNFLLPGMTKLHSKQVGVCQMAIHRVGLVVWVLFSALFFSTPDAHAFLAVTHDLDGWQLEQSPEEIISKYGLAIKLDDVERVRGARSGNLIILRLESPSLCFQHLCQTIAIRHCETPPCPQATILAAPAFTPMGPGIGGLLPDSHAIGFEGFGKKSIFLIVGPKHVIASTFFWP